MLLVLAVSCRQNSQLVSAAWICSYTGVLMLLLVGFIVLKILVPKRERGCDGIECIRTQYVKIMRVS
jgi:hypothetical protein